MLKTLFRPNQTHLQSFAVPARLCDPMRHGENAPSPLASTLSPGILSNVTYVPRIHLSQGLRHWSPGQGGEQTPPVFLTWLQVPAYKSIPSSSVLLLINASKLIYQLARIPKSTMTVTLEADTTTQAEPSDETMTTADCLTATLTHRHPVKQHPNS